MASTNIEEVETDEDDIELQQNLIDVVRKIKPDGSLNLSAVSHSTDDGDVECSQSINSNQIALENKGDDEFASFSGVGRNDNSQHLPERHLNNAINNINMIPDQEYNYDPIVHNDDHDSPSPWSEESDGHGLPSFDDEVGNKYSCQKDSSTMSEINQVGMVNGITEHTVGSAAYGKSDVYAQSQYISEENEVARLQALYELRGKQVDQLTKEHDEYKSSSVKKIHELQYRNGILCQKEQGLLTKSQALEILRDKYVSRERNLSSELRSTMEKLEECKLEEKKLRLKVDSSEGIILNLENQVRDLQSSESLAKSKQIHEAFEQKLKLTCKKDTDDLEDKLQSATNKIYRCDNKIIRLNMDLSELHRDKERIVKSKTDRIHALTNELQVAEERCRMLHNDKLFEIPSDVKNLQERNIKLKEKLSSIEEQFKLAKENLETYDMVLKFGIIKNVLPSEDSLDCFNLAKALSFDESETAETKQKSESNERKAVDCNNDSTYELLKQQLCKTLLCNKKYRGTIQQLEEKISSYETKIKKLESDIKSSKFQDKPEPHSSKQRANNTLVVQQALEESESNCRSLKTKTDILEMQLNEQKNRADAIETFKESLKISHEDGIRKMKQQLASEYVGIIETLEARLNSLKQENARIQENYIAVCKEKSMIQGASENCHPTNESSEALNCDELKHEVNLLQEHISEMKLFYDTEIERLSKQLKDRQNVSTEDKSILVNMNCDVECCHQVGSEQFKQMELENSTLMNDRREMEIILRDSKDQIIRLQNKLKEKEAISLEISDSGEETYPKQQIINTIKKYKEMLENLRRENEKDRNYYESRFKDMQCSLSKAYAESLAQALIERDLLNEYKIKEITEKNFNLKKNCEKLELEKEQLNDIHEAAIKELTDEIQNQDSTIKEIKNDWEVKVQEFQKIRQEMSLERMNSCKKFEVAEKKALDLDRCLKQKSLQYDRVKRTFHKLKNGSGERIEYYKSAAYRILSENKCLRAQERLSFKEWLLPFRTAMVDLLLHVIEGLKIILNQCSVIAPYIQDLNHLYEILIKMDVKGIDKL